MIRPSTSLTLALILALAGCASIGPPSVRGPRSQSPASLAEPPPSSDSKSEAAETAAPPKTDANPPPVEPVAATAPEASAPDTPPAAAAEVAQEATDPDEEVTHDEEFEGDEEEDEDLLPGGSQPGIRYTNNLSDARLAKLWHAAPNQLGTVSVGYPYAGRLFNGLQMRPGPTWAIISPPNAWGTRETIHYMERAFGAMAPMLGEGERIRVNHISAKNGGWLRPHRSHQAGRDVDIGFIHTPGGDDFDMERNWAMIRTVIAGTDIQMILVDRGVIARMREYALSIGEDPAWVESVMHSGRGSIIRHAAGHRDHFHFRFFNARSQELGARLYPYLPKVIRKTHSSALYRVRRGDTLSSIAARYGTSVAAIKRANPIGGHSSFGKHGRHHGRHGAVAVRGHGKGRHTARVAAAPVAPRASVASRPTASRPTAKSHAPAKKVASAQKPSHSVSQVSARTTKPSKGSHGSKATASARKSPPVSVARAGNHGKASKHGVASRHGRARTTTVAHASAPHTPGFHVGRVLRIPTIRVLAELPPPPSVVVPPRRVPPTTPELFTSIVLSPEVLDGLTFDENGNLISLDGTQGSTTSGGRSAP